MTDRIIEFVRKKDLVFIKKLGQGACGETVILYDDVIDENFVCKKYAPIHEPLKEELFDNFVREIKLLHLINHPNIVRVFNYYIYPDQFAGYILMELVNGTDIEEYLTATPARINEVFLQTIAGFRHLENHGILHRDIRPQNILVSADGTVKVIDFGFGKRIETTTDFDKSITLNWWCQPPSEFADHTYNFATEVYFVGKLFEKIILGAEIEQFAYKKLLHRMCEERPSNRIESFAKIEQGVSSEKFSEITFTHNDLEAYRYFANDLSNVITKIERGTKYYEDPNAIERKLEDIYRKVMLEEWLPSNNLVLSCFLNGGYYFSKRAYIKVTNMKGFLELLRACSRDKKSIVLGNIHSRLDAIPRYDKSLPDFDEDIPF